MKVTAEYFLEHNADCPLHTVAPRTEDENVESKARAEKRRIAIEVLNRE